MLRRAAALLSLPGALTVDAIELYLNFSLNLRQWNFWPVVISVSALEWWLLWNFATAAELTYSSLTVALGNASVRMDSTNKQHFEPEQCELRATSQYIDDSDALLIVQWTVHRDVFSLIVHILRASGIALYLAICLLVEVLSLVIEFPAASCFIAATAAFVLGLQDANVAENPDNSSESDQPD
jgi:hypothetical protein